MFTKCVIVEVVQGCPDLREICIRHIVGSIRTPVVSLPCQKPKKFRDSRTTFPQTDTQVVEHLRSLKHLAVVDVDFVTSPFYTGETGTADGELYVARIEADLKAWKRHLIEVLKDSLSEERKFLRWATFEQQGSRGFARFLQPMVLEEGELEILPETFL